MREFVEEETGVAIPYDMIFKSVSNYGKINFLKWDFKNQGDWRFLKITRKQEKIHHKDDGILGQF